jgi:secondary thiamine-phosphate synthase enzyme
MSARRLHVETTAREQLMDITSLVEGEVAQSGIAHGCIVLFSLHTTCALTVNEGFDPDVAADITKFMRRLVPEEGGFAHAEGNSDAHIKVAMFGPSLTLLIEDGRLLLGRWQRIFLAEWDGPRPHTLACSVFSADP